MRIGRRAVRLFCCLAALCLLTSFVPYRLSLPLPDVALLQRGDWILRGGMGADSRIIRHLSRSAYSHIGIIVQTRPHIIVVHATTDDDVRRPNQVLATPLAEFLAPDKAESVLVLRPHFLNEVQRGLGADYAARQIGRPFVLAARQNHPFYCTTLIAESVEKQGVAFHPVWQYLDTAVFHGEYLFPEAFLNVGAKQIYRYGAAE